MLHLAAETLGEKGIQSSSTLLVIDIACILPTRVATHPPLTAGLLAHGYGKEEATGARKLGGRRSEEAASVAGLHNHVKLYADWGPATFL